MHQIAKRLKTILYWLRNDLRLHDNAALTAALAQAGAAGRIVPVYVIDPGQHGYTHFGFAQTGPHRRRFLHESLYALDAALRQAGSRLIVRTGAPHQVLPQLARQTSATALHYHAETCPDETATERAVDHACKLAHVTVHQHWGHNLVHPADLPFDVPHLPMLFTEFRRLVEHALLVRRPLPAPTQLPGVASTISSEAIPQPTYDQPARFAGGEAAGLNRLAHYLWEADLLRRYKETRNGLLGNAYSSQLSPWLANGCLSPRTVFYEVRKYETQRVRNESTYWLILELLWRDYFYLLAAKHGQALFRVGGIRNLKLPWSRNARLLRAWQLGQTGTPLVDACMRELLHTGYMGNRARQIAASYFTKNLGLDWRLGAEWFESLLVDYDPASNYGNWNYAAGIGTDARGFRYFNIPKQAEEHDPEGHFVRHWVPALRNVPAGKIHAPHQLDESEQAAYGVHLGHDYPLPVVDLAQTAEHQRRLYEEVLANPLLKKGNYKLKRYAPGKKTLPRRD